MRALFAALLGLSAARGASGAAACTECEGDPCILDGSATPVTGGATSLALSFCNFDAAAVSAADISFGALFPPACDAENATLPVAAALQPGDACTADACAVTVTFERALDWALALRGPSGLNALTAAIGGEVVTVATFLDVAGATLTGAGSDGSVSVCAASVPVSAVQLSLVKECNIASLCLGAAGDTACTTPLQQGLLVDGVSCTQDACTGNVTLASALPCDGASGNATALIVGVQVAASTASNFLSVGSMVAASNFSFSAAAGLEVGSSEIVLTTGTFCDAASVELSLAYAGTSVGSSSNTTINVSSVNTTSNGTVVVALESPLTSTLEDEDVTFSLSQCGVPAIAFTAAVAADPDSLDDSASASTDVSPDSSSEDGDAGSGYSAQETNSSAGLSGGLYVGIGIGVLALLGFIGECCVHKRRQAKQPSAANPANATVGYANAM